VQDGLVGLVDAILRWTKETTGSHFENYVAQRAQGAMLDGLRSIDPATRQIRREMRRVEVAIQRLSHRLGRAPQEGEVAAELEMELSDYQRILQDADGYVLISLEDLGGGDDSDAYFEQCVSTNVDPLVVLERSAFRKTLASAIESLPEQRKEVLRFYYEEELKMREVGDLLDISESRVSQLLAHTIAQLRANLLGDQDTPPMLKPRVNAR
jgi:RNA polymerase sigma factor for flagellar operon FliA